MSSRKANVMLVNLTLRNFAAGKPSVNDSVFAATSCLPVSYFMTVEEMPIRNTLDCLKFNNSSACQTNM